MAVNGKDLEGNTRTRIIVLTALLIGLGLIPALWKILREFSNVANYRKRWMKSKCQDSDMGWLSASKAPGFVGWGEKRLKDYLLKTGLSSKLETAGESRRERKERERRFMERTDTGEGPEIDVESLFSIGSVSSCHPNFSVAHQFSQRHRAFGLTHRRTGRYSGPSGDGGDQVYRFLPDVYTNIIDSGLRAPANWDIVRGSCPT
jgi:hypothetical protein